MLSDWTRRLRAWLDAPAWPLPTFLLIALALRLPAVLCADGFDFVDQQYQYVDPAWNLATGGAWHVPWEWIDRVRGEAWPWFLAGLFRVATWLGIEQSMPLMRFVRGVFAVLSLLPVATFWLAVVRWRPLAAPRLPLLLFAGSGLLIGGVQPNAPATGAMLAVTAALAIAGPLRSVVFSGVCLGFAFCCRFQDAMFGPGLLGALLWQRRLRSAAWFAVACLPGILVQGALDVAGGDAFLATTWRYVSTNLGGASQKWKTQPFWFYAVAGALPVIAFVPPCLRVAWSRLRAGAAVLPGALAAATVHIGVYSTVARKALRFEHGALAMLVAVIAVGVGIVRGGRFARLHTGLLVAVHVALFAAYSLWFGNAGAVRMAEWLHSQPGFDGRVTVVGSDATALGGFFYLRPPRNAVVGVTRAELAARAAQLDAPWIVSVREPLSSDEALALRCELVASFHGQFDLRAGERRFVYRRRARRITCRIPSCRSACRSPAPHRSSSPVSRQLRSCASWRR